MQQEAVSPQATSAFDENKWVHYTCGAPGGDRCVALTHRLSRVSLLLFPES